MDGVELQEITQQQSSGRRRKWKPVFGSRVVDSRLRLWL